MYKIIINEKTFRVNPADENSGTIDEKNFELDLARIDDRNLHVLKDSRSYNVEIVSVNPEEKKITFRINGRKYPVEVKDRFDLLLEELGFEKMAKRAMGDLKAPMPGLVLRVEVAPGQTVSKGDPLVVLEAMKMENIIKAAADGTVKSIEVEDGMAVEKNQVLIKFG